MLFSNILPYEILFHKAYIIFVEKIMPTVLIIKGYRFFFYINDHTPPHIHVEKGRSTAKYDLRNAELVKSKRFNAKEISEIRKLVIDNAEFLISKWDEYFNLQ